MKKGKAVSVGLTLAALVLAPESAAAQDRSVLYAKSGSSFRKVGELDRQLTKLCRDGKFNQIKKDSLYIGYTGPGGGRRTITGVAKFNYNLYDPTRIAEPQRTYHFHNDGYSNCSVYVALEGAPPNPPDD